MGGRIVTDTTDYFAIDGGDSIHVERKRYKVLGHAFESSFGIDDPKFWVKRVVDVDTREKKIIKLAFFETFETDIGGVRIRCFRSPDKEAKILKLVKRQSHFMQGTDYLDPKGNNVRILDVVRGENFLSYVDSFKMAYDAYLETALPGILKELSNAFEALRILHVNGFRHGDIRNDHIIVEKETGNFVWIDFDYDYETTENPFSQDIFGLGTILSYAIGKGFHTAYMIANNRDVYGDLIDRIDTGDFSLLDKSMFLNLRKLYPSIPIELNQLLMNFSNSAETYYESVDEIIVDMNRCLQPN